MAFIVKGLTTSASGQPILPASAKDDLAVEIANPSSNVRGALDAAGLGAGMDEQQVATTVSAALAPVDPVRHDPTRARALKSALARVKLGTGRLDVLVIGDSWVEGGGASARENRLLTRLRDLLRKNFQPSGVTGGAGYRPSQQSAALPWPTGYTFTGTAGEADHTGLGRRARSMSAGSTASITGTVTSFRIAYEQSPNRGVFTYSVDGGPEVEVNATQATQLGGRTVTTDPLPAGTHTLRITAVGQTVLEGVELLNGDETQGVHVWEAAKYGWSAGRMMADTKWLSAIPNLVSPDVVISTFGINDYQFTGWIVSPSQFETNYRALINGVRGKTTKPLTWFIYVPSEPRASADNPAPWSQYRDVLFKLANEFGFGIIDGGTTLGAVSTAGSYGIGNGDGYHLSDVGHEVAARHLHASLTAKADYVA